MLYLGFYSQGENRLNLTSPAAGATMAAIACSRASCPSRADAGPSPRTAAPGGRGCPPSHRLVQRADRARSRGAGRDAVLPGRPADADAPGGPASSPAAGVDPPRIGFIRAEGIGKALHAAGRRDRGAGRRGRSGATRPLALPGAVEELSVRVGFLESFPPGHAHFSRIDFGPSELSQRAAQLEAPSFDAGRRRSAWSGFRRFLILGIQHIFTGYDHVAFLIGLMLWAEPFPSW